MTAMENFLSITNQHTTLWLLCEKSIILIHLISATQSASRRHSLTKEWNLLRTERKTRAILLTHSNFSFHRSVQRSMVFFRKNSSGFMDSIFVNAPYVVMPQTMVLTS